jgi:DNA adenine methylase
VSRIVEKSNLAKPFLKWAGGKTQLLGDIESRLPAGIENGEIDTYVESFVGGGAVFFHIAQRYEFIKHFYLFDINQNLVNCYNIIKNDVDSLIKKLKGLKKEFLNKSPTAQKDYYLFVREKFNNEKAKSFGVCTAAKLIFLNKTCFNGLYRVNSKGDFNVPFGSYKNPAILNEQNLRSVSEVLQKTEIICGDFEDSGKYIDENTFVYFDPPYRPISTTASFTSYSKEDFNEDAQIRLSRFCYLINDIGAKFLLSNSDPKNENPNDTFFEKHYRGFMIDTVRASRQINCKGEGRGQINELLITNYMGGHCGE